MGNINPVLTNQIAGFWATSGISDRLAKGQPMSPSGTVFIVQRQKINHVTVLFKL